MRVLIALNDGERDLGKRLGNGGGGDRGSSLKFAAKTETKRRKTSKRRTAEKGGKEEREREEGEKNLEKGRGEVGGN